MPWVPMFSNCNTNNTVSVALAVFFLRVIVYVDESRESVSPSGGKQSSRRLTSSEAEGVAGALCCADCVGRPGTACSCGFSSDKEGLSRSEGIPCTSEVQRAIPLLKKAYGDSMLKVLHVGPETCSIVAQLLKEEETETWGVEPYDLEDADSNCKTLVRKGIVRVADIKFPLPYRADSFNLVIVSDALDYLSPKYLNRTLLEICGVLGLL